MASFGLGTLPNVLAISAWFRGLATFTKSRMTRFLGAVVIAAVGVWGVIHAIQPAAMSAGIAWCLQIPGAVTASSR
jgi:sulfite exporter TauE/SafE